MNRAVSGRSARSYTREGKWSAIATLLKAGDCELRNDISINLLLTHFSIVVVIEFGGRTFLLCGKNKFL